MLQISTRHVQDLPQPVQLKRTQHFWYQPRPKNLIIGFIHIAKWMRETKENGMFAESINLLIWNKKHIFLHNLPWTKLKIPNYCVDHGNAVFKNIKWKTPESNSSFIVHKKNWFHLDLFFKHPVNQIGFDFYWPCFHAKAVFKLPLLNLHPPLPTFTYNYTFPITSSHAIKNNVTNVTPRSIAACKSIGQVNWSSQY